MSWDVVPSVSHDSPDNSREFVCGGGDGDEVMLVLVAFLSPIVPQFVFGPNGPMCHLPERSP